MPRKKKKFNIITFDGGGIRGVFTARILQHVVEEFPQLLDNTQMFSGTSTGGIIALGIGAGYSPEEIVNLYAENSKQIFYETWYQDLADMGGLYAADFDNKNLKKIMRRYFNTDKLADLEKLVLIPTFRLYCPEKDDPRWRPKFFHNFPGSDGDHGELVVDVAMRTSAAPTYFPTYQGYIDGGVVANDPSMAAIAQAIDDRHELGIKMSEINLLSIGTGYGTQYVKVTEKSRQKDWGAIQWAKPMVDIFMDSAMGMSAFQAKQLLDGRFYKFNRKLPEKIDMAEWKKIPELIDFADQQVDSMKHDLFPWIIDNML